MAKKQKSGIVHRDMNSTEKSISLVLFILLVVFTYLSAPFSRLQSVSVSNGGDVAADKIIVASNLKANDHYFETIFFKENITNRIIEANPKIKTVNYDLKNDNHLVLQIEEHEVVSLITRGNNRYAVLSNGVVIDDYVDAYKGSVPEILWNGTQESVLLFASEFSKITEAIREKISNVTYQQEDLLNATIFMKDGNQVKVSYTEFHEKMNYYDDYLQHTGLRKGVFDLTVGIFFAPYQR